VTDQDLVQRLCDIESGLSEWEMNFVDSLVNWLKTNTSLTKNQRKKAEEVFDRQ